MGALNVAMILHGEQNRFIHYLHQGYLGTPEWQIIAFYLGVLFITMWVAVWPVTVGLAGLVYLVLLGLPLGLIYALRMLEVAETGPDEFRNTCYWIAAGALLCATIYVAAAAWWRGLAGPGAIAAALLCYAAYTAAFVMFVRAYNPYELANVLGDRWPHPINWPMWIGLSVLPVAPLFAHPYFLERARHR
jgi:hypothetical protein